MRVEHLAEVHAVDVIRADDDDDVGLLVPDEVEALQDGVGRAAEPPLAEALLGRDRRHIRVQQRRHPPRLRHVPVEAVRLVLGQHHELSQARIDQIRYREIDQAVLAPEGNGGLRTIDGEGHEALTLTTGEDDSEDLRRCRHGTTLERSVALVLAFVTCASTSSPRSIRPRSTAGRGCTRPSS